ncbi:MAG: UDP-3-O-(3-hydroxymyristoyl)glucosamine N-acyltransferase [Gemmatimonadota bacterium]
MISPSQGNELGVQDPPTLSLKEIAELVGGRVEGDPEIRVNGIAPLSQAGKNELGFLAQRKYLKELRQSEAGALLVSQELDGEVRSFPARVLVKEAHAALPSLLATLYPARKPEAGVHPTAILGKGVSLGRDTSIGPYAVVEERAVIGDRVRIGPHAVVGSGCVIGEDSVLHPQVVLYPDTVLGARVILHAGVRLGVDGFGYVPTREGNQKVPQVGACVVEDDVEIGANTAIDRGSIGRTVIGRGTKIDNLVHLAHNVEVGRNVLLAGMVGIAGSATIGDRAMFGGQVGVAGHTHIGEDARVGAQAGVIGDVSPGETISGYPARNHREYLRAMGMAFKLPDTLRKIKALEERIRALEEE